MQKLLEWKLSPDVQFKPSLKSNVYVSLFGFKLDNICWIKYQTGFSPKVKEMVTYAYLRVSTDYQDLDNQRLGILEYVNTQNLGSLKFVEDATSGRIKWQSRAVGQLLTQTTEPGDVVIFAEISRMARSTLQVLEMLECCMQRGISVHIAKQQMVLDGSMSSRITATVLGLAAEIERELISLRTTEALAKCKAEGKKLGRPKGQKAVHLKLDEKEAEIRGYLAKGISKRAIAKLVECSPSTLYQWMERRHIHPRKKSTV